MIVQGEAQSVLLFILNPAAMIVFLILGALKVRDGKAQGGNPYNYILSMFFFSTVLGLIINIYYAMAADTLSSKTYIFLARLAAFFILWAAVFAAYFVLVIYKGIKGVVTKQKLLYFSIWTGLYLLILVIGNVEIIDQESHHNAVLAGYEGTLLLSIVIFFSYYSWKNLNSMSDPLLKRKYIAFMIGFIWFSAILLSTLMMLAGAVSREFGATFLAISMLPAGYLIYYGIGRPIQD